MFEFLKGVAEKLSGNKVWIEPSADPEQIASFIKSLRPKAIKAPLIRLGGVADGGYLLPNDLDGIGACISPGVSTEVSFDRAMADRGIDVFMADASVAGPPAIDARFHFLKKFVDVHEDESNIRLDSLCGLVPAGLGGDRLLQMDIEGAEYRVLLDASDETLKSFRIMTIEFHHLSRLYGRFSFRIIRAAFQKLLRFHEIVHVHPNNHAKPVRRGGLEIPAVMEFTFYRKDRFVPDADAKLTFPHLLDRDNVAGKPSVVLPKCWQ
ncbi:FkbM family methyltransferase [Mesorhizobium sp.]|uniref:FkbM family methyltransferase n=1 Tax=Mesorhizobium sp. TaxID=1871066 RepID=UPI000FE779EC|nr:FkbM family methyltransferase [Mesorhizobium sp.]RWK60434.1 MAG: hypothetical protein EOR49_21350 [Mesorhizobium sp.]RWM43977.1 MAG: hypothetical protein EOR76_27045 [Mesorhizobium sp.]RWM51837.1 MAG: hypothetical protein EOR78_22625 [Mesorhizobium sp.]RWM61464.1 MAG: hypothetical protein EOR79_03645 [Mesorhizobium sp.]RWM97325.1 MAG: hypothetical protein EOR85_21385 [Mesorhizobium sp.]